MFLLSLLIYHVNLFNRGCHFLFRLGDLLVDVTDHGLGVLAFREEADVVFQQRDVRFELFHLVVQSFAFVAQAAVVGVVCRQVLDFAFEAFQMTLFFIAAQLGESGIDQLTPFVLDSFFLPDRHESGFGPAALQFFQFVESLFLFVREADTAQMVEAYARWVALISDRPADAAPMDSLMRRASASRPMLDYFTMLAQQVIHDPNSPLRNDEFYIPVMQAVLASPYYDEYERIGPAYDLAMASQNRLGQRANDFRYTLASGATGTLYGVKAEYTLLFINNPGCGMCKQLREQISGSPMLSEMIERGRLKILALYPDEDLTEWRNYRDHIPATWINAYDAGCLVRENGTYDLTAIPSLYLLDSDKRVLVKDSTDVPYIEEVIDRRG